MGRVESHRQAGAAEQRQQQRPGRYPRHRAGPAANRGEVELEPDGEGEDDQAQSPDRRQGGADLVGEEQLRGVARQPAEQRGAEQEPGQHIGEDLGLMQAHQHQPQQLGDREQDREVEQQPGEDFVSAHRGSPPRTARGARPSTRR